MILIDETKLTKDVLARVLEAQGVDISTYVKKAHTEEQVEILTNNLKKCSKRYEDEELIKHFKESVQAIEYIDYDELFDNELYKFHTYCIGQSEIDGAKGEYYLKLEDRY